MKKVAVIMGSDSDWPVVKGACTQLDALDIPYEAHILSAHRTPTQAAEFAKSARERGFGVVICAAGMAAHLAGAFAANTTLPVIGIPMKGGVLDGLDALLATAEEIETIKKYAFAVNDILKAFWAECGVTLVDFKLEFGRLTGGTIVLADEISPDTCRLWDEKTHEKLDKDRFRRDLGGVEGAYAEVMQRLLAHDAD